MPLVAARTSPPAMTRPDDSDLPLARLRDLVAPGRLLLVGFAFWTAFALIFSIEYWLLAIPEPFPRIVASQLASWWPCALLTPPLAAGTIRIRALGLPRPGAAAPRRRRGGVRDRGRRAHGRRREPASLGAADRRRPRRGAAWGDPLPRPRPAALLYGRRGDRWPAPTRMNPAVVGSPPRPTPASSPRRGCTC